MSSRSVVNDTESKADQVSILGEICCADHLRDDNVRPFAVIRFGSQHHRTLEGEGRNPIWSLATHSVFALSATARDLAHEDLHVSIWSNRLFESPLCLGSAVVDGEELLANEEYLSVELKDPQDKVCGGLTLRFRLATNEDEAIVRLLQSHPRLFAEPTTTNRELYRAATCLNIRPLASIMTEEDEAQVAGASLVNALSSALNTNIFSSDSRVLVKPYPDPDRQEETMYLTKEDLKVEAMKPSKEWVAAGSGNLGKVYLEVLACHGLPNVDMGEAVGNVSDCFVCAVFEDAMVQTPVIDDELSPHWMPWTQRAFCFSMMHPASVLYLGVFDFDLGITNHEPIGRVAVNISKLRRDTEYTLEYALHQSSNVTDRTPVGKITIRVRVDLADEKQAILEALKPRPKFHVNVQKEKSLATINYTCFGEYGNDKEQNFDLTVMRSYINEILEYKSSLRYCVMDALWSLIFWKGQVKLGEAYLPVHSYLLFCVSTVLVERPSLFPSFLPLSVAWIMLAIQTQRSQHPSPWSRCPPFWRYVEILLKGKTIPDHPIHAHEGEEEAVAFEEQWQERLEKDQRVAETRAALQQEIDALGDESIHTKIQNGLPLDLMVRLARYQSILARVCRLMRKVKIVLTWEESILSFWITAIFLVGGLVSLLLPWPFLLLWTGRLLVWGLLGPHMKIVALMLDVDSTDDNRLKNAFETFKNNRRSARLRHQEAVKLRDIKSLSFGPYSTLLPSFNLSRHHDYPLAASFSVPYKQRSIKLADKYIPGQQCFGAILPRTQAASARFEAQLPLLSERLDQLAEEVHRIEEDDGCKLIKKLKTLCSAEEDDNMPDAVGYEMIDITDQGSKMSETGMRVGDDSSLMVTDSKIAILSEVRSGERWGNHSARFGYELISMDEDDDATAAYNQFTLASTSALLMNSDPRLAIMETNEPKSSPSRRYIRRESIHDDQGVEVILDGREEEEEQGCDENDTDDRENASLNSSDTGNGSTNTIIVYNHQLSEPNNIQLV